MAETPPLEQVSGLELKRSRSPLECESSTCPKHNEYTTAPGQSTLTEANPRDLAWNKANLDILNEALRQKIIPSNNKDTNFTTLFIMLVVQQSCGTVDLKLKTFKHANDLVLKNEILYSQVMEAWNMGSFKSLQQHCRTLITII